MYNVIWIDDEWEKMTSFVEECKELHDILLTPFKAQQQAMDELDRDLDKWDAVILDAKMFDKNENEVAKLTGLRKAIDHLNQIALQKRIPYFISTGQPDLMDNDIFKETFGHFYIKGRDDEKLIEDIKKAFRKAVRHQIRVFYQDALDALHEMDSEANSVVLDILEVMHKPGTNPKFDGEDKFNKLRQILEKI